MEVSKLVRYVELIEGKQETGAVSNQVNECDIMSGMASGGVVAVPGSDGSVQLL